MKICVSGTQCVGKSTFIKDFVTRWPMYKAPTFSYREEVRKRGVKFNRDGDIEGQRLIQTIQLEQLEKTKDDKYVIYDRGPLDNLIYSIWHNIKDRGNVDDLFIEQSIAKTKDAIKAYDIIFFIPLSEKYDIDLVEDDLRDTDPTYRKEIDNLFKGVIYSYYQGKDTFFDMKDTPAIIEIFGSREERIQIASLYVNENGDMFGDKDSLIDQESLDAEHDKIKSAFGL